MDEIRGLTIDPGSEKSLIVRFTVGAGAGGAIEAPWNISPVGWVHLPNEEARIYVFDEALHAQVLAVETLPTIYDGAHARDQVEAQLWAGSFIEAFRLSREFGGLSSAKVFKIFRATAKAAVHPSARTDAHVRRAIVDVYGGDRIAFGKRCKPCHGQGWRGRRHDECEACHGDGFDPPKGELHGWPAGHAFAALACAFAVFRPGGPYWQADPSGEQAS